MKSIFEISSPGRRGVELPKLDVPESAAQAGRLPAELLRKEPAELPEVAEVDVVRHFTNLSRMNFGVDVGFYPLGSCTMKYNPKFTETASRLPGFAALHPLLPQLRGGEKLAQGSLAVLFETDRMLSEITGMAEFTLQPMAGAHGELTGIMLMAAYHRDKGNQKTTILNPSSMRALATSMALIPYFSFLSSAVKTTSCMHGWSYPTCHLAPSLTRR